MWVIYSKVSEEPPFEESIQLYYHWRNSGAEFTRPRHRTWAMHVLTEEQKVILRLKSWFYHDTGKCEIVDGNYVLSPIGDSVFRLLIQLHEAGNL